MIARDGKGGGGNPWVMADGGTHPEIFHYDAGPNTVVAAKVVNDLDRSSSGCDLLIQVADRVTGH